jgi:hypothetical protein
VKKLPQAVLLLSCQVCYSFHTGSDDTPGAQMIQVKAEQRKGSTRILLPGEHGVANKKDIIMPPCLLYNGQGPFLFFRSETQKRFYISFRFIVS